MEMVPMTIPPADEVRARLEELITAHGEQGMNSPLGDYIASLEPDVVTDWADPRGEGFGYKFECTGGDEVRLDMQLVHRSAINRNGIGWRVSYELSLFRRAEHKDIQIIANNMVLLDAEKRNHPPTWEA
ncbi:hypothetical protein GRI97_08000 [Altererythrobacter xixiisoli]|uniref:Uncharacterized protein n=1 Tax=Croceibacterium xixiisoli TaxID=1476466 RepID=A0A6I4TWF8_9SPHN|nr:hypothetical protein [Croceibacterium xixiisoli]MXO98928.1 hypothetical protein [Croceibacterium xixiisoli]